jgi:hypothetical protein
MSLVIEKVVTWKGQAMVELTLISPGEQAIQPLIEAALVNEQRLLEVGLRKTQQRLQKFEEQSGMSTDEFVDTQSTIERDTYAYQYSELRL